MLRRNRDQAGIWYTKAAQCRGWDRHKSSSLGQCRETPKKNGPIGVADRPKSREETPKEGYDRQAELVDVAMQHLRTQRTKFKCEFCRADPLRHAVCAGATLAPHLALGQGSGRKEKWAVQDGPSLGRKRPYGQRRHRLKQRTVTRA